MAKHESAFLIILEVTSICLMMLPNSLNCAHNSSNMSKRMDLNAINMSTPSTVYSSKDIKTEDNKTNVQDKKESDENNEILIDPDKTVELSSEPELLSESPQLDSDKKKEDEDEDSKKEVFVPIKTEKDEKTETVCMKMTNGRWVCSSL